MRRLSAQIAQRAALPVVATAAVARRGCAEGSKKPKANQGKMGLAGEYQTWTDAEGNLPKDTPVHENPVNVEDFTLNEQVVNFDMKAQASWNDFGKRLDEARAGAAHDEIVKVLDDGFALLQEVGMERSPAFAKITLCMEKGQVLYNKGDFEGALKAVREAERDSQVVVDGGDIVKWAEAKEFAGYILFNMGKAEAAEQEFLKLLKWIDHDSRREMPFVQGSAKEMKRTTEMGLGMALLKQEKFSDALDRLTNALPQHIEAKDYFATRDCLRAAIDGFIGLKDTKQAVQVTDKLITWCRRHDAALDLEKAHALRSKLAPNEPLPPAPEKEAPAKDEEAKAKE